MKVKQLWFSLAAVMLVSFAVLLYFGREIYFKAPPVPKSVLSENGQTLITEADIMEGQRVWQSIGGQELGSIWGHGAYVAPDWSADWLHREAIFILDIWAGRDFAKKFEALPNEQKAVLQSRLTTEFKANRMSDELILTLSEDRAQAVKAITQYYLGLFGSAPELDKLREAYAMPANVLSDPLKARKMASFFFWTAWAAATQRPGDNVTYTNNWPPEKLVGNEPSSSLVIWTGVSVILLLLGIGLLTYYYAAEEKHEFSESQLPQSDPFFALKQTPSMRATLKYFWVVTGLIVFQIIMGVVAAHYAVEGKGFYGFPLAEYLPYATSRTWHIQLGLFWIATSWLATGLYIAPAISGHEPKFQQAGVNFLFISLLIIVVGSSTGEYLAIAQKLDLDTNFWFGHQGLEYVDLGRFWQIYLFVGLWLWLALVLRAIWPAIKDKGTEGKNLLVLFLISCTAIALFYGAGLMWGKNTNLAIIEYWRWWVVHLWVEGFFEVFATVVIAFLFVKMQILRASFATVTVLFSTIVFLFGGILGTFHHLYFSGTPTAVLAIGATFSALEVVPLVLIGFEAYQNVALSRSTTWLREYKWPIYCFISVAFWNFLGAGIFGFVINPPIALYYMQGLNTTPLHGHTALFGVYGMLGIGLMLFCLKTMGFRSSSERLLGSSLWMINIGLFLMAFLSLLPVGLLQTLASVEHGLWYARSAEFMQTETISTLRWLRAIGDTIFALGAMILAYFVLSLRRR